MEKGGSHHSAKPPPLQGATLQGPRDPGSFSCPTLALPCPPLPLCPPGKPTPAELLPSRSKGRFSVTQSRSLILRRRTGRAGACRLEPVGAEQGPPRGAANWTYHNSVHDASNRVLLHAETDTPRRTRRNDTADGSSFLICGRILQKKAKKDQLRVPCVIRDVHSPKERSLSAHHGPTNRTNRRRSQRAPPESSATGRQKHQRRRARPCAALRPGPRSGCRPSGPLEPDEA